MIEIMKARSADDYISNWSSQARKGLLELMVMSLLAEREFYGYALAERLRATDGFDVTEGTLYTILARLQRESYVRPRWENPDKGPARKYYTLTKKGHAGLRRMQHVWAGMVRAVERTGIGDV